MAPPVPTPTRRQRRQLDPAQAAAALQEWTAKKWVWVPDQTAGYLAGHVVKEEGDVSTVALTTGGNLLQVSSVELRPVNPPNYDGAEDIANLTFLNEASVVHNLKTRYEDDCIYTYSGLFLVAVNPYKSLPIYSATVVERYKNKRRDENEPHVYAVAEQAWQSMLENQEQSQSILVTGESGAGKTENTKKIIQYLAAISADPLPVSTSLDALARRSSVLSRSSPDAAKQLGHLERQILEANPILEAFGNAQTVKNNNSSRFGKFVRIFFNPIGAIAGANIDWYLLEKSRVTGRSEHERNFHVFFQLLRGADSALRSKLLLTGNPKDYEYLKHSRQDVDGMDDVHEFRILTSALDTVGFTPSEQLELWKTIAAILHLGNVSVGGSSSSGQAHLSDPSQLEIICHLLGLRDASLLLNALVRPKVKAGNEWVVQARTKKQVTDELAALAKSLYEKCFGAIVDRINKALGRPATKTFIGVLDIAGFEIFDVNGFEQLLINLTNEKLQQFFNHRMFVLEQEEYAREQIDWEFRSFGLELQPTIDLIESSNPMGILSCLDDACIMPKATDQSFTEKLHQLASSTPSSTQYTKYRASRIERGFTVSHYAGAVEYRTDGWLDKNRDPLSDTLASLLAHSSEAPVAAMFAEYADLAAVNSATTVDAPRPRVRRGAFRTVGQRHKDQLAFLMTQLRETQPHFVRCIVPNGEKRAGRIDTPLVLHQLACNGVLEGIRIARLGFPNRLAFAEFRRRFEILAPVASARKHEFVDGKDASRRILDRLELDPRTYQLGLTKVFFKAGILAEIEAKRDDALSVIFTQVQAAARRFTARRQAVKILHRAQAVRIIQRNARLYGELRAWPWWPLFQRVRPLLAAARSDDEMRRKEDELVKAKEEAEKAALARAELQRKQQALEEDKRKMEADLASEQRRCGEAETLLMQSKERESELEEDLEKAIADVELMEDQLDRFAAIKQHLEARIVDLDKAVVNSNALVQTLQAEQQAWSAKEAEWESKTSVNTAEWDQVQAEREQSRATADRLAADLADRTREHSRLSSTLAEVQKQLVGAKKTGEDRSAELAQARSERATAQSELASLTAAQTTLRAAFATLERGVAVKDASIASLTSQLAQTESKHASLSSSHSSLALQAESSAAELEQLRTSLASHKALLEAKVSDHEQSSRLNAMKEAEVISLKGQVSQAARDLGNAQDESSRQRQELDRARRDKLALETKATNLAQELSVAAVRVKEKTQQADDLQQQQQEHGLQLEVVRTQMAEDALKQQNEWEKERQAMRAKMQKMEDEAVEANRARDDALRDGDALRTLLEQETATLKTREAALRASSHKLEQQLSVLADLDKINGELRRDLHDTRLRLKLAEDKGGKVVIEHIKVLEESQRLQNLEIQRMLAEESARNAHVRTLERARVQLTQSLEDLQHQREADRQEWWASRPAGDNNASTRAMQDLESERRVRQLAELNVGRLQSEIQLQQQQLQQLSQEVTELRRANLRFEQELTAVAASDATSTTAYPSSSRRVLDSRAGNVAPSPNRSV
ncbi:hypothetical protein RQP46_002153 [Phenoliferia psychrophenolica]